MNTTTLNCLLCFIRTLTGQFNTGSDLNEHFFSASGAAVKLTPPACYALIAGWSFDPLFVRHEQVVVVLVTKVHP